MLKIPRSPNLTELAYLSVKQHILAGSLVEGSKLTEESLSNQLGISKSPVREALNRLESEGLICIEARRGAYVRKFSPEDTRELYDLRVLLETHAVGIAKITPRLLNDLSASIARTRQHLLEGDKVAHINEDMNFHNLIMASTENRELCKIFEGIQQKTLLSRSRTYHLSATTAPQSHAEIHQALCDGDRAKAQQAMRQHILFVRDTLLHPPQEFAALDAEQNAVSVG